MLIPENRNIAFKITNEDELQYVINLLRKYTSYEVDRFLNTVNINIKTYRFIWIYYNVSFESHKIVNWDNSIIGNPTKRYPEANYYLIMNIKQLMRQEKLKRINNERI